MGISGWFYFWVFTSIPLINLFVSVPIHCNSYNYSPVVSLEVRDGDCFIVKNCFCYSGYFVFPDEFENCSFHVFEESCCDFDRDFFEAVDCFWLVGHFHYVNSNNPWAWEISPISEVFYNFFLERLEVLVIQIFICLVRVTLKYFTLFVTIVKDVVSLISFPVRLSFAYRKATGLFELILNPATLRKLFISYRSSL